MQLTQSQAFLLLLILFLFKYLKLKLKIKFPCLCSFQNSFMVKIKIGWIAQADITFATKGFGLCM